MGLDKFRPVTGPQAPRIKAYLERSLGVSSFVVPRRDWDSLQINSPQVVAIDVEATPMRGLARDASLIGAVAAQGSTGGGRVSIYRYDPKDPLPVNVDHYTVLTNLGTHPQLDSFIIAASTSHNANLDTYLNEHVVFVKDRPGADHWLPALPATVAAVIDWGMPG